MDTATRLKVVRVINTEQKAGAVTSVINSAQQPAKLIKKGKVKTLTH